MDNKENKDNSGAKGTKPFRAGYEYLLAWKITVPIYDLTVEFCNRCCSSPNYPNPFPNYPDSPNFPNLPNDPTKAVNLLITLINQANYLQARLKDSVEKKFVENGGFRENLLKKRLDYKRGKR